MNWNKHGTPVTQKRNSNQPKRVPVPVTDSLLVLIDKFKETYPDTKFSDAAVLKTFIEAGAKEWYNSVVAQQVQPEPQELQEQQVI